MNIRFNITRSQYLIRISVVVFAMITPFVLYLTQGYKPSISEYWNTPMQPLFILSNAATSYYLFSNNKWKLSASLLLLLTAFSVESYLKVHNVLAICFFLSNLYPLYITKHYRFCFWLYLASLTLMPLSIILGETVAVIFLSLQHGLILRKIYSLHKR